MDDTHMTSMKIAQFSRLLTSFVLVRPKFFDPLNLGRSISNELPPSPNDNQSIKRKHNPRITIICYQVLPSFRSAFIFSFISLIFSSFPLTSLHLAEASNLLFCGFTLLCVQLSKNITKCLLFIIVHIFSTHFAINLFYLHNLKT